MLEDDYQGPLLAASESALEFLASLAARPVRAQARAAQILSAIDRRVPEGPSDATQVVRDLARAAEPGLTAMPSGRFFGWVIGGAVPAALAADWLTSAWDQNAGSHEGTPAAAAFEQVALRWVLELLDLPDHCSAAIVTGAQVANTVGLAAARNSLLHELGWDVEAQGLRGSPEIHVLIGAERHDTITRSLRLLGFGAETALVVKADENGRMLAAELKARLEPLRGPVIVCAQIGNVNTGGVDPIAAIADLIEERRAKRGPSWLHVDGAFGLWARASRSLAPITLGAERADSWATDGHKWPNVPYDCGIAIVARPEAHRRAMAIHASYLPDAADTSVRNPFDWTPELSRRARGFALYAALAQLGRTGIEAIVDRSCAHARNFRDRLLEVRGVTVLNEVLLNQVLVRFEPLSGGDADEHTRAVVRRVQADGTCYATGTTFRGLAALRISVSNWSTDERDVERSVEAIARAHRGWPAPGTSGA
jgi:glutamate/tyrosine decarboxylase-like PLP-dependent enzyme